MVKTLEPTVESFCSKLGEKLTDYAHKKLTIIKDFKYNLETLRRNLNLLSDRASDVEKQIKHADQSGKKKRKAEVENWLTEVKSIETEFLELGNELQTQGFISRFLEGGRAAELNGRVEGLVEQSRHFGELLLDVYEARGETLLPTRLVGKAFDENLENIWGHLVDDKKLDRIVGFFIPKVRELLVDYVHENLKDFKFTLETLERNLKSLSARAFDAEEQIKNAELSGKKKRKREVENWLSEVKSIETEFLELENELQTQGFISRFLEGGRAAELNGRVEGLVEQSRHFGELLLDVYEARGETLLITRPVGKAFDENLERIWRLLDTSKVSSIGIYGMGGVDKTTLAKHINNRLREKTQARIIWVTVSQAFTIKKLQDEIAKAVGVDLSDEVNEEKRAARLHGALSQKKNILILDDVWEYINLEKVGYPVSVEGFRLIITTSSVEVCRRIDCEEVVPVKKLNEEEAWNLFRRTLGSDMILTKVQEIAKSMARQCDGLPLGIITLAGSMRGETDIHVWCNVLEELKESFGRQDEMDGQVFKVLKYSFDRLNPNHQRHGQSNGYSSLQRCFLYCSLYPEDYKIKRDELISKFITEDLMDKRRSRKALRDQGHSILNKLVNVCLLESAVDAYDRDYDVKMHDLVRAMALKINEGKTMVRAGDYNLREIPQEEEWTKDLEKVSLMMNDITLIPQGMSPNCPKLSTLLLQDNDSLSVVPDSFFSQMQSLCTLDLSQCPQIGKLPNSLFDLESLKALLLGGCAELEYVPYLGKLNALRELDLSGTGIKQVPQGIEELLNLKFLSIDANELVEFPEGLLLRFGNLQYLKLPDHIEAPIEEIKRLNHLEEFWGRVKNVCDFNRFIRSGQNREYDTFYCIQIGLDPDSEPPERYNELQIHYHNLEEDEAILGEDIQYLTFNECEGLSNCLSDGFAGLISNAKPLKQLEITACGGIECILTIEQLIEQLQSNRFSTLEEIKLWDLSDFKGVIFHSNKREILEATAVVASALPRQPAFSSLRRLTIYFCRTMKKLGLPVSEFPNLEEISVSYCDELEEIIEAGEDDQGREEGEAARFVTLPKLKQLELERLPKLKSICKATMICSSIEQIALIVCPTLKKLPLNVVPSPPPALKEIFIVKEEWESMEWEDPTHPHLLQPFLHFHQ